MNEQHSKDLVKAVNSVGNDIVAKLNKLCIKIDDLIAVLEK